MYQNDTEILFPMRVAPMLRDLRGKAWSALVDSVVSAPADSEQPLAFNLLMIELSGCLTCHTDSYRAMRGCTLCAQQAVRRFRGGDEELLRIYEVALTRIRTYLESM
jgi:hypothetical protein